MGILKNPKGNPGTKNPRQYMAITTAFDIETTYLEDVQESIMYIWQFQLGEELTVYGRTWDEFRRFIKKLKSAMPENMWLVCYVHNLSYEIQYLKSIYHFQPSEVFAIASRKALKADMSGFIELRCSYKLTNMSLDSFTQRMNVEHKKLSGAEFNYNKKRFPWTKLTARELQYCINDVQGLVEAVNAKMALDGDTLATIPLTSTGYVRREVKNAIRNSGKHHNFIRSMLPDWELYQAIDRAIAGGYCHASRWFSMDTVYNVLSSDRSSSYPAVMCNRQFPMSKFTKIEKCDLNSEYIGRCRTIRNKALLLDMRFINIRLRNPYYPCPYLSANKCRNIEGMELIKEQRKNGKPKTFYWEDNGRIIRAKSLDVTITDVDLDLIQQIYVWDSSIIMNGWYASYDYLPDCITDLVRKYYTDKTELKGVPGQELFYDKQKALLNSIFGMMCQRLVKRQPVFTMTDDWPDDMTKTDEQLFYEANQKAFVCYQWACWVTAWARYELFAGINLIENTPGAHFVYCDTDSVKYIGQVDWTEYNNARIEECKKTGSFATDPKGITHYMGVFESENNPVTGYAYLQFRTMGAKKYAYISDYTTREERTIKIGDKDYKYTYIRPGACHVTVSGVNKKLGGIELDENNGLESFEEGFTFVKAGGTESVYSDKPRMKWYRKGQHKAEITANVSILPSTYTLGISGEYDRILRYEENYIDNPNIV
ncbi:MAG: hypothetical protein J6Y47_06115 [Bacteroidales bacterium]|nr:hypothetical protein [Bacteroidales bacterium]